MPIKVFTSDRNECLQQVALENRIDDDDDDTAISG